MAIYQAPNNRKVLIIERERHNDQVIIYGNNESFLVDKGVFFIEYLQAATGTTVTVKDGKGNTIVSALSEYKQDWSPIRCDYGISITGNVDMVKGFIVRNVFGE